eukprot:354577-Chlamydomonas_euryale.AAC.2
MHELIAGKTGSTAWAIPRSWTLHPGSTLALPWLHRGSIVSPSYLHGGSALGLQWLHRGSALGQQWLHLAPPWLCPGPTVAPPWLCPGPTVAPPWLCPGPTVAPPWLHQGAPSTPLQHPVSHNLLTGLHEYGLGRMRESPEQVPAWQPTRYDSTQRCSCTDSQGNQILGGVYSQEPGLGHT